MKPIKLGRDIELRYIPFSELAIPWNISVGAVKAKRGRYDPIQSGVSAHGGIGARGSKASKTLKREDLDALKHSIGQFGLLKPFEVAELPERLDFFYGKGRYVVIDGQRRYFALRELLRLPTEHDERTQMQSLRTDSRRGHIVNEELQAQELFSRLSIRDYVLVPCLVYPYTTLLQMVRHSNEDKKFSVKPSKDDLELAEKMHEEGVEDLKPEDLTELWETRSRIDEERQAIEKTLHEIRSRMCGGRVGENRVKLDSKPDGLTARGESRKAAGS